MARFKRPEAVNSFGEMKEEYIRCLRALKECQQERKLAFSVGSSDRKELQETREEVKETTRQVKILTTREEQLKKESKQTAVASTTAATLMVILYQIWDISHGWPGGSQWQSFWQHEAVSGSIMWGLTMSIVILRRIYEGGK
jgi:C4-dicarboxylate-specific signal transduction histidine kinase